MKTIIEKKVEGFENAIISENEESWFVDLRTGLGEAEYPKCDFTLEQAIELENGMIRETVKEAMKLRNVKSKDLAEHVEVTKSTMSLFLNGKTNLGQEKIEKILDFLDIKLVITK